MKEQFKIINGDSLEILKQYPDEYFDSIVTDPPYGLAFMGKDWDKGVPKKEIWIECLRVLKKGGHLIAFAGTRTQHRMAVNIEDAGFEIRDMGAWLYGSGFPKSHNISKAIDKKQGNKRDVLGDNIRLGDKKAYVTNNNPENQSSYKSSYKTKGKITKSTSEDGIKWEGWGTALKPALEPFTIARKPFKGTVADNVLENGTGGLNIDACRIETEDNLLRDNNVKGIWSKDLHKNGKQTIGSEDGRFPANLIHDGSQPIVDILGEKTKYFYCPKANKVDRNEGLDGFEEKESTAQFNNGMIGKTRSDGSVIKEAIKQKNSHPTVKPTDLMAHLCRLITPKDGIILDPFAGSGSTGKAAIREGFKFVGVDLDEEYCKIAKARIENEINKLDKK